MTDLIVQDSKQAILDAAQEILARGGYAGLSMRELSRQSGLAKSTLYHYFQDKHQIYLSVLERDLLFHETELHAAAGIDGDPIARLTNVVYAYFDLLNNHGSVALNALRRVGELDRQLVDLFQTHRERITQPVADILNQGIAGGQFRAMDTELATWSLFAMMNGFVAQRLLFDANRGCLHTDPTRTSNHTGPQDQPDLPAAQVARATQPLVDETIIQHTLQLFLHGIQRADHKPSLPDMRDSSQPALT